ncbi:MAG: hypothetical protein CM1200mP22_23380 [Dehalococcoidia bacterium]|nr:MAG: hypothetical protein CM1200mP22_23380 [Dehalococcoidia bacterium]
MGIEYKRGNDVFLEGTSEEGTWPWGPDRKETHMPPGTFPWDGPGHRGKARCLPYF